MRRHDTGDVGDKAEAKATELLRARGFDVENLNDVQTNFPTYDLLARKNGTDLKISVKCARARRDLSLGRPSRVASLEPGTFMIALLPAAKDREINIDSDDFELWIVPSEAILSEALAAHEFYWAGEPEKSAANTIRIKDKIDRPGGRSRTGAVFTKWSTKYRDAWHLIDEAVEE